MNKCSYKSTGNTMALSMALVQHWVKCAHSENDSYDICKMEELAARESGNDSVFDCLNKLLNLAIDIGDTKTIHVLQKGMPLVYLTDTLTRDYNNFMHYYFLADPTFNVNESLSNNNSCTCLIHYFTRMGSASHIRLLLQRGAEVDKEESATGMTALMLACRYGDYNMVKVLLDAGAHPLKGDKMNRNALSLAFLFASEDTLELVLHKVLAINGHTIASVLKYICDIHIWHKQIVSNSESKYKALILVSRWEKYWSGRSDNLHGLSFIVENISGHVLHCSMLKVFFSLANDKQATPMIKLLLKTICRQRSRSTYYSVVQYSFKDAVNKMCPLSILSAYSSVLWKMDKDYISHYRSCEQWEFLFLRWKKLPGWNIIADLEDKVLRLHKTRPERIIYNIFKVYWILQIMDIIGIISNFGIVQHFQLFLAHFGSSTVIQKSYKGLLCYFLLMKHPHLWKYFYCQSFDMLCPHTKKWESLLSRAYQFSEWYGTTPRNDMAFLPMHKRNVFEDIKNTRILDNIRTTVMKPHISGYCHGDSLQEREYILSCIKECLWQLSRQLERSPDVRFSFVPVLSGSAAEGTKTGYLNELDFLLEMKHFKEKFDNFPLETIISMDTNIYGIQTTLEEFRKVLNNCLKLYQFPAGFALEKLIPTSTSVKPFRFILLWRGRSFKDLMISVDLVPAFLFPLQKVKLTSRILHCHEECPVYIIPKNVGLMNMDMRLSFSLEELRLINNSPDYIKHAYRLAKAMRHHEICPSVETAKGHFSVASEYISSYMLKTCLFHAMSDNMKPVANECSQWLLCSWSIHWAIKIYERMEHFLKVHEGKIPHYFHVGFDICSRYQVAARRGEEEENMMVKKTETMLFFVRVILQLLKNSNKDSCQCENIQ